MKFSESMNIQDRVDTMARWVIVNSIIYYDLNYSVVADKAFDEVCKELVFLITNYKLHLGECYYWSVIKDFDGTTGFDLSTKITNEHKQYLTKIANNVVDSYKRS